MGQRCGCAGTCGCVFKAGRGARLSGGGSKTDPLLVEIRNGGAFIRGSSTPTVQVVVTGTGTAADPYLVSMNRYAGVAVVPAFVFTTPGSYVFEKPSFGTMALVHLAGGGGGGGAGTPGNPEVQRYGIGGAGGTILDVEFLLADLPAEVPLVVGAGGGGGTGGSDGGNGTTSYFNGMSAAFGAGGLSTLQGFTGPDPRPASTVGGGGAGGLRRMGLPIAGIDGGSGYPGQPPSGGFAIQ
jgi:hypothetical protein